MHDIRTLFVAAWVGAKHLRVRPPRRGSIRANASPLRWTGASVVCTNLLPPGLCCRDAPPGRLYLGGLRGWPGTHASEIRYSDHVAECSEQQNLPKSLLTSITARIQYYRSNVPLSGLVVQIPIDVLAKLRIFIQPYHLVSRRTEECGASASRRKVCRIRVRCAWVTRYASNCQHSRSRTLISTLRV